MNAAANVPPTTMNALAVNHFAKARLSAQPEV